MTQTEPQFTPGDRVFSHYTMTWGTVAELDHTVRGATHGVTGEPLRDTTWYEVTMDDGSRELLDDAHGDWRMSRIVPPFIAERYGYGSDPGKPEVKRDWCRYCDSPITLAADGAWEDDSGACGCGRGEHEPGPSWPEVVPGESPDPNWMND